jgi:hypothetical protein
MGEDWGALLFLAFLASWLLALWLLASVFHFLPARRTTSRASWLGLLGALARPAVSAAATGFDGSHVIGHLPLATQQAFAALPSAPLSMQGVECGHCGPNAPCEVAHKIMPVDARHDRGFPRIPAFHQPAFHPIPQMGNATKSAKCLRGLQKK